MLLSGSKSAKTNTLVKKILISQPKPESEKSPYFDLERKYNVELIFQPFIKIDGLSAKDFRKQKIELPTYSAVIFTSRHAIDHFFRICEEMKIAIGQTTKYFCITESVALYLQKFILYRKRKVFYGADGTNRSLFEAINKHKENEKFLYVCSENQQDNEIESWLRMNKCEYDLAFMYRSISNDIKLLFTKNKFDIICLFTPSGVKSLFDNFPKFKQNGALIGSFGKNTEKIANDFGLSTDIKAPTQQAPSMISALDIFLSAERNKNKK
jgi:Uroporphyrinogen-III synthase